MKTPLYWNTTIQIPTMINCHRRTQKYKTDGTTSSYFRPSNSKCGQI